MSTINVCMLEKMSFGSKWIRQCIFTMRFSILVNSSFRFLPKSSRSLRQEDPLSTYLFILAMETLSCILLRAKEGGFIDGFLVRGRDGEGMEISHLLFADNTLIFCDASKENIE